MILTVNCGNLFTSSPWRLLTLGGQNLPDNYIELSHLAPSSYHLAGSTQHGDKGVVGIYSFNK